MPLFTDSLSQKFLNPILRAIYKENRVRVWKIRSTGYQTSLECLVDFSVFRFQSVVKLNTLHVLDKGSERKPLIFFYNLLFILSILASPIQDLIWAI